jgi:NAD(P)-dependent dehydrogenase (short-subunit alcohol dehydrogenase family)
VVGIPLIELDSEKFSLPVASYTKSYFLTARAAARRMVERKSGVIMTVSALMSRTGAPAVGGYSAAMAAKEAMTRGLSLELAPLGIRVVCLRPHAMPESSSIREVFELKAAKMMSWEQWQAAVASRTHTQRLMTLEEMANVAAFMASDKASGMTGTTVNLTMGNLDD